MTEQTNSGAISYKKTANVTLPLLKVTDGVLYAVTIKKQFKKGEAAPARKVKVTDPETGEIREEMTKPQEPPVLTEVVNLLDGKEYAMIAGAVFHSEITKQYPDHSYVGKSFEFTVHPSGNGKRYKVPTIAEVEIETTASAEPQPDAAEKPSKKK